jgi:hypothetical protein
MTNEEWAELTRHRKLPAEVRQPIEAELDLYSRFASATASPPSVTKENLEHAAELASKLLKVIERFGPDEHRALVWRADSVAVSDLEAMCSVPAALVTNTPRLDALKWISEHRAQLIEFRDETMKAAARIEKGKRDAGNVRALVKRVSQIIEAHGGPLTKAKPDMHFAEELGKLAFAKIGRGSMKEAIDSLEPELAAENSDNPG